LNKKLITHAELIAIQLTSTLRKFFLAGKGVLSESLIKMMTIIFIK
jgi:hypothetical protein